MIETPEQTDVDFCVAEAVRHARTLSYCDCLAFLRGFATLAGEAPEIATMRNLLTRIQDADDQLDLIARPVVPARKHWHWGYRQYAESCRASGQEPIPYKQWKSTNPASPSLAA